MENTKSILILCTDNYIRQPRVLRTIEALQNEYTITVAGLSDAKEHAIRFIDLSKNSSLNKVLNYWHFDKPFFIKLPVSFYYKYIKQKQFYKPFYFEQRYWANARKADFEQLNTVEADLIISHGIDTLPLAVKLANKKIPVIFNAHEYYPLEFEQDKSWLKTEGAAASYTIGKYLPQCSLMFCVSENIQKKYQQQCEIVSEVITNATSYRQLHQKATQKTIRIIHHGAAMRARQIELMAEMMQYLDERYELYFMLIETDKPYLEELKKEYENNKSIHFLDPVNVDDITSICNNYDIGLFILPPVNFNWLNALPNKLFEYVQARIAIAVSPNPDMKKLVLDHQLGVVADNYSPQSMADKILELSIPEIDVCKANCDKSAHELSAEMNKEKIKYLVNKLLFN